ncbi:right-handed parallel beta-helix repeat-containing protein, partial [candidate division WOR-3 bacterium]|nr:right-handed parallel beta-helix repeat-containing protein [candidate division WOR-3 bacterium]
MQQRKGGKMKKGSMLIGGIVALLCIFGTAHATVWYVHPDSIINCIQDGLDSCSTSDTVLVGPGTYYENINWPGTQGIDLISELGSDTTIIDGDSIGRVVLVRTGVDSTTVIKGFTIRNGYVDIWWSFGGGIHCLYSSPTITNNVIINNTAGIGGGIACDSGSSPLVSENFISGNTAGFDLSRGGGGIYCCMSAAIIVANTITNNQTVWCSVGGGISCWYSSPIISNNNIHDNFAPYGGGISCTYSSPFIDSCTISNNLFYGIYCEYNSAPEIHHNNICDNMSYGVINVEAGILVNAQNNWWGDSSGPYHPATNPGGLGDTVSDYVDFDPWLTAPVGLEEQPVVKPVEKQVYLGATIFS